MVAQRISILSFLYNYAATCENGIVFESYSSEAASSAQWIPYYWNYLTPPAVFGMVNSYYGGAPVTVRSFNHSKIGVGVILQQDLCGNGPRIHSGETISFFTIGVVNSLKPTYNTQSSLTRISGRCMMSSNIKDTDSPTATPSAHSKRKRRPGNNTFKVITLHTN